MNGQLRFSTGLTLVELMLAMLISGLLFAASVSIYGSLDRMRNLTAMELQEVSKVNRAMNQLSLNITNMYRRGTVYSRRTQRQPLWASDVVIEDDHNGDYDSDRLRINILRRAPVREGGNESDVRRVEFGVWSPSEDDMLRSQGKEDFDLMASKLPLLAMREDPLPRDEMEVRGGVITALAENVVGFNVMCLVDGEWLNEIEPEQLEGKHPQAFLIEVWIDVTPEREKLRGNQKPPRRETRLITLRRLPRDVRQAALEQMAEQMEVNG